MGYESEARNNFTNQAFSDGKQWTNAVIKREEQMERWLIQLDGHAWDVEEFASNFPSGEAHCVTIEGQVFLTGPLFNGFDDAAEVLAAASHIVSEYFGVIALLNADVTKPTVEHVVRETNDGERQSFTFVTSKVRSRSRVLSYIAANGESLGKQNLTSAQILLAASRHSVRLGSAVSLLALPNASWTHLYRSLEELECFLDMKVDTAGLCSAPERERLKHSANSAEAAGQDSRHRGGKYRPPKDPLSIGEAKQFMSRLVVATLRRCAGG